MYYFETKDSRIMICAETLLKPDMVQLTPPEDFVPDEMHNWRIVDGEFVYEPLPVEEDPPTQAERIAMLEEQNAMLTECLLEMSEMLYA